MSTKHSDLTCLLMLPGTQDSDNRRAPDLDPNLTPSAVIQTKSLAHLQHQQNNDLKNRILHFLQALGKKLLD